MTITFFSAMMAFYAVALMLVIVYVYRSLRVGGFGIKQLYVIVGLCVARIAFPVEFSFSKDIAFENVYNPIIPVLFDRYYGRFCVAEYLRMVWCIGTFFLISRVIYKNIKFKRTVLSVATSAEDKYRAILETVQRRYSARKKVAVMESCASTTPFCFGFFSKYIVLPKGLTEEQTYYSLLHEYAHVIRRDVEAITLTNLFCCYMWWNPFVYLLRIKMEETLELNCDNSVMAVIKTSERVSYLETIVAMIKRSDWKKSAGVASSLGLERFNNERFIVKRFRNVADNRPLRRNVLVNAALMAVFMTVFVSSYTFVFQSYFDDLDNAQYGYTIDEDSYLIYNDGRYDLYNAGIFQLSLPDEESALQMIKMGIPLKEEP